QHRLRRIRMKIVKKWIFARVERPEHEDRSRLGRQDFFLTQLIAFEFGRRIASVHQLQLEPPVRWDFEALRRNRSILELDRENRLLLGSCNSRAASEEESGEKDCREITQAANLHRTVQ